MKTIYAKIIVCLVLAVPFMLFVAFVDPIRESISLRTYSISFSSLHIALSYVTKGKLTP